MRLMIQGEAMPTYEYKCDACGGKFELFQSIKAQPARKCALCGASKVRRLIGAGAGIIFKGSGFYKTDYRSDSYKKAAEKEKAPSTSSGAAGSSGSAGGGTSGSGESKPASKPSTDKAAG